MMKEVKVSMQQDWISALWNIWIYRPYGEKIDVFYSDKIVTLDTPEGCMPQPEPSLRLTNDAIVAFINAAQSRGFDQEKVNESKSVLTAKESHLQDMRSLVFSFPTPAVLKVKEGE